MALSGHLSDLSIIFLSLPTNKKGPEALFIHFFKLSC